MVALLHEIRAQMPLSSKALKQRSSLRLLDLSGTGVTDVSSLSGLSRLRLLEVSGTGVTDTSSLSHIEGLSIFGV